jgi:sec-independent protein translocase protein TatA
VTPRSGPRPVPGTKGRENLVNLGPTELIIILAIVLLLFGGKKLPSLARSLGKSSREFKKGMAEGAAQDEEDSEVQS